MRRTETTLDVVNSEGGGRRGQVIVLASGKGGVGKTNLALNLGIALARRGQDVALFDADFGLANADILLDVSPLTDFSDLLDSGRPLDDLLVRGPCGLPILCGVSGVTRRGTPPDVTVTACRRALDRVKQDICIVIVYCGAGVAARLARVAAEFLGLSVVDLGHVVSDRHVPLAVRQRVPVTLRYPRCAASLCMEAICDRVVDHPACPPARPGVWARAASLFL